MKPRITREQLAEYERDGFLVLEKFADPSACDRLRSRAEELVREFVKDDGHNQLFAPN